MELKRVAAAPRAVEAPGLNRTFMELKLILDLEVHLPGRVLIVPLWN